MSLILFLELHLVYHLYEYFLLKTVLYSYIGTDIKIACVTTIHKHWSKAFKGLEKNCTIILKTGTAREDEHFFCLLFGNKLQTILGSSSYFAFRDWLKYMQYKLLCSLRESQGKDFDLTLCILQMCIHKTPQSFHLDGLFKWEQFIKKFRG